MRFAKVESKYYCCVDLHSRSMYISVMDKEGEILLHCNMPNDFDIFKNYLDLQRMTLTMPRYCSSVLLNYPPNVLGLSCSMMKIAPGNKNGVSFHHYRFVLCLQPDLDSFLLAGDGLVAHSLMVCEWGRC